MVRLIDAEAVKYEPLPKGERNYRTYDLDDAYDDGYNDAMFDIKHSPTVNAVPIQYILTTIREWNRDGYAESAEALEILLMNWDKENTEWAERKEE